MRIDVANTVWSYSAGFPHQIDHIISRKHGGSSGIGNLAYACVLCNRYKGTDIASIDRSGCTIRFFDPRRDSWDEHFKLHGPVIQPLTAVGEVTARMLRLNAAERVIGAPADANVGSVPKGMIQLTGCERDDDYANAHYRKDIPLTACSLALKRGISDGAHFPANRCHTSSWPRPATGRSRPYANTSGRAPCSWRTPPPRWDYRGSRLAAELVTTCPATGIYFGGTRIYGSQ